MSSKIPVQSLLSDFRMMYQEHWSYGTDTKRGQVDCSGAFVWAYQNHGCSIYHGSNRIAREEVLTLIPISKAKIVPGMAAFKSRSSGLFSGYALPSSYQQGGDHYNGDLNDYYHIGLVDNDTSKVLNAQSESTGFVYSDIKKGGWTHVAYLKQVDYGETESEHASGSAANGGVITATVYASSGRTVNMRSRKAASANLVVRVPIGDTVEVVGEAVDGWVAVRYGKYEGFMMAEFLKMEGGGGAWAAEVYDITKEQAEAIKRDYPSARIFETVG